MLPLSAVRAHVGAFPGYARQHPVLSFELTPIGCGLAFDRPEQIAPMFADAPTNVALPTVFIAVLALEDRRRPGF